MRPLRILHVAPYSADAWAYGGIPRLAHTLSRGLARRGHYVTVCTTDACDESARLAPRHETDGRLHAWAPTRTDDGVELRVFPNVSNRLAYHLQFFLPLGLNQYLSAAAGRFDVAHLHACRNVPGAIAAHHLHRAGVPYVLAPNGTAPRIERRQLAKQAFDIVAGQRVVDGAARVLAVSRAEVRQLDELDVDPAAVQCVPNPIDLDEFKSPVPAGRFRARFSLPNRPDAKLVVFLGKLTPRKRLDVLVRACAALASRDVWLAVVGNDMGAGQEARLLVRALNLESRTIFTGLARGRERLEALADADLVVYPSEDEIFGLVPIEALMCGTPVVVAGDSGCGEVIRSIGGGEIVAPGDVDALAAVMTRMLDAPEEGRRRAVAAAERARASYGDDVVCARLEGLYAEIVNDDMGPFDSAQGMRRKTA